MLIDTHHPLVMHTRIWDSFTGKERYFKWIEIQDGRIIEALEAVIPNKKPLYTWDITYKYWDEVNDGPLLFFYTIDMVYKADPIEAMDRLYHAR